MWLLLLMFLPGILLVGGSAGHCIPIWCGIALEQALWARREIKRLIHHSDGCQYLSIRYTERLIEANIEAFVGSVGDSYDNALAETINGLYKTEVIRYRGPWRNIDAVQSLPWNGLTGLTITGYWSRLEIFHQRNSKWHIIANWRGRLMQLDSN